MSAHGIHAVPTEMESPPESEARFVLPSDSFSNRGYNFTNSLMFNRGSSERDHEMTEELNIALARTKDLYSTYI